MSPEVLIYIGNVKKFFSTNEEAYNYFFKDIDEDDFYSKLLVISQNNFEKNGDPMLLRNQFEEIRNDLLKSLSKNKENYPFIELKNFGKICLN